MPGTPVTWTRQGPGVKLGLATGHLLSVLPVEGGEVSACQGQGLADEGLGVDGQRAHRPAGTAGPVTRGRDVFEGSVTSYGVCGHFPDSLSAWDHSDTLLKPEQARSGRFYGIMFFRKDPPQTEGRRDADLLIKTSPGGGSEPRGAEGYQAS